MPAWRPLLVATAAAGVAILVLFPDYLDLQTSTTPGAFLGVLGDGQARATAAAVADVLFAVGYGLLGVVAYQAVATGVPRLIGVAACVGAIVADEVENVLVMLNARGGDAVTQSSIDTMTTAGSVKWALVVLATVLLLALLGQRRLEERGR